MKIVPKKEKDTLTLRFDGRLSALTEMEFKKEIDNLPEDVRSVILDFAKLTYISSIGLVHIYALRKKLGAEGSLKIIHAKGIVKTVLEISGTDILFEVSE